MLRGGCPRSRVNGFLAKGRQGKKRRYMRVGHDQQQEIKPCSVFKTLDADADGNGAESIEFEHNRSLNAALVYVVKYKKCLYVSPSKQKTQTTEVSR